MNTLNLLGNTIDFNFKEAIKETGNISEDFDYHKKQSYATCGIQELLNYDNDFVLQTILGQIFQKYYEQAKIMKLDYLQTLTINGVEVWILCDYSITLLKKDEY